MDRNLGLEAVRLTEAAAISSARLMGRGDEKAADQAAVDAMRKAFNELHIRGTVLILNRPRHERLMAEVRASGARIKLIGDGDVSAAIATCFPETGVDVLMGIGGAPEGVIAAAALRCCGGDMQGQLKARNDKEIERARKMGIPDINKIFTLEEMAKGHVVFAA